MSPREAAVATLRRLDGAFALLFLFDGEEDLMIAARKGSPLAIGHGDGEMFVGSDAIALAPMTNRITYLEEGDYAFVTREGVEIFDIEGRRANREVTRIQLDQTRIEKAGYKHFMAKEIAEQPVVLADAIKHYTAGGAINLPENLDFSGPRPGDDRRLRHRFLCRPHREILVRKPCGPSLRGRYRLGIPLPRATDAGPVLRDLRQPVRRDGRHACRAALLRRQGCEYRLGGERPHLLHRAGKRRRRCRSSPGWRSGVASTKAFTCQLTVLASPRAEGGP